MLVATMSSVVESIGDYYASARICRVPFPPPSAMNRAVAMEGLASVFSGMLGAGHATTSYSNNTGAVGITKVSCRYRLDLYNSFAIQLHLTSVHVLHLHL